MRAKNTTKLTKTITAAELAELSNLSPRRIYQLVEEKRLSPAVKSRFPLKASLRQLFQFYQRDRETLQREKMLKCAVERKMREIELGQLDGRLTDTKEAQMAVTGAVLAHHSIVKARMDRDFAKLVLEKLEGIDELTRHKIQDAVTEVGRGIVKDIEDDCANYGRPAGKVTPQRI